MKNRILLLFLLVSGLASAQATWDFKVTSDSARVYLSDTVHGIYETYPRCGLNVYKTSTAVSLFNFGNIPINKWVTGSNLPFLAPTVDSGYKLLSSLVLCGLDTGRAGVPLTGDASTYFNGAGSFTQVVGNIKFTSNGASTYTNGELSDRNIISLSYDGVTRSDYTFSGSTVTFGFTPKSGVPIIILYQ